MDKKSKTIQTYSDMAKTLEEGYDEYFKRIVMPEAEEFLKIIPHQGLILDAGCGAGTHSSFFLEKGYRVKAIDLSPGMIAIAKKKGIDATEMDLEDIRLQQTFDGIWCHTSLIHLDSKDKVKEVIERFREHLKPDAPLFIALREGESDGWELHHNKEDTDRWFLYFKEGELEQYIPEVFKVKHCRLTQFKGKRFLNYLLVKSES